MPADKPHVVRQVFRNTLHNPGLRTAHIRQERSRTHLGGNLLGQGHDLRNRCAQNNDIGRLNTPGHFSGSDIDGSTLKSQIESLLPARHSDHSPDACSTPRQSQRASDESYADDSHRQILHSRRPTASATGANRSIRRAKTSGRKLCGPSDNASSGRR